MVTRRLRAPPAQKSGAAEVSGDDKKRVPILKYMTEFAKVTNQNTVKSLIFITVVVEALTALIGMLNVYALNVKLNLRSVTEIVKYF